jgi:hypothetical protein
MPFNLCTSPTNEPEVWALIHSLAIGTPTNLCTEGSLSQ